MEVDAKTKKHVSSNIQKFFDGQTILITGGTGFIGKVLLEKLLRSVNVKKIYLLVRQKKNKSPEERFKDIFDNDLFGKVREEKPDVFSKVFLINGDIQLEDNGISSSDKEMLINEVTCVFHSAATINFTEPLRMAFHLNVRSLRDLLQMAKQMKNLKAFMHISTAFANCTRSHIDEMFYPLPINSDNLQQLMDIIQDDDIIETITPGLLNKWPNTYVFTKAVGEDVVRKNAKDLPVGIFRPGIVMPTYQEPVSGWANSIIGFCGLFIANSLGVLRVIHADVDKVTEIIPVDYTVNCLIAATWEVGTEIKKQKESVKIYNYVPSTFENMAITWKEFMKRCKDFYFNLAPSQMIWYPILFVVKNYHLYVLLHYIFHVIPGFFLDKLLILFNKKPILLRTYEKIHKVQKALAFFAVRQWQFKSDNVHKLYEKLDDQDKKLFNFNLSKLDLNDVFNRVVSGGRQYILKESPETLPSGQRKFMMFKIFHYTLIAFLAFVFFGLIWKLLSWF